MKILHLLQSSRFSGAENVACQIIEMTGGQNGAETAYCSRDGDIRSTLAEKGIKFFPLTEFCKEEISHVISKYKPDIIHAHDMLASVNAALTAPKNVKIVSHIHNSDFRSRRISAKSLAYLAVSPRFSNIIWVSNSCFYGFAFHKLLSKKSRILYNVINRDKIIEKVNADTNDYSYDFSYIGRLADPKNPLRFVRITKLVSENKPDVKAAIVGTGELETEVKAEISKLGLENNIDMPGFMPNPLKVMSCSKALVMTSDREGMPMAALEATALGIPIVSTPTDGLCDLITQGENGFLESDETALAKRLLDVISDGSLHKKMSDNVFKKFTEINDREKYKDVLNEIYGS